MVQCLATLAEMRAFISLNTFTTHPTQVPLLKLETLGTSVKAPPPPQPRSGACRTAEGTSGHRKEHFRRKASLPSAQRAERKPLGAQTTAAASLAGGSLLLRGSQLFCWRQRAAPGEGRWMAMLHPSWGGARVSQLGRRAQRSRETAALCARPTAGQRSAGCDPNHRRRHVIPVPALTGDSGRIAEALLPLLVPVPAPVLSELKPKGNCQGKKCFFVTARARQWLTESISCLH